MPLKVSSWLMVHVMSLVIVVDTRISPAIIIYCRLCSLTMINAILFVLLSRSFVCTVTGKTRLCFARRPEVSQLECDATGFATNDDRPELIYELHRIDRISQDD